jgi:hypothetical protein
MTITLELDTMSRDMLAPLATALLAGVNLDDDEQRLAMREQARAVIARLDGLCAYTDELHELANHHAWERTGRRARQA